MKITVCRVNTNPNDCPPRGKQAVMYFWHQPTGQSVYTQVWKKHYVRKLGLLQRGKGRKGRDTKEQKGCKSTEKQASFIPLMIEQYVYQ